MVKYTGRKFSQNLSSNMERRLNNRDKEVVTNRKREDQIIEEVKQNIADLDKRAHLSKGRAMQKIEEEIAYTLPLECFGFGRK